MSFTRLNGVVVKAKTADGRTGVAGASSIPAYSGFCNRASPLRFCVCGTGVILKSKWEKNNDH